MALSPRLFPLFLAHPQALYPPEAPVPLVVPVVRVLSVLAPADLAAHCFPVVRRVRVLVVQLVHAHPVLRVVPDLMESDPDYPMALALREVRRVRVVRARLNLRQCNRRCCC